MFTSVTVLLGDGSGECGPAGRATVEEAGRRAVARLRHVRVDLLGPCTAQVGLECPGLDHDRSVARREGHDVDDVQCELGLAGIGGLNSGVGVAVPHVDIQPTYAGAPKTYGYQVTGPAVRLGAGVSYSINDRWSVFGEYQFTWSDNKADINGGGTIETTLITNALNFGVGYSF